MYVYDEAFNKGEEWLGTLLFVQETHDYELIFLVVLNENKCWRMVFNIVDVLSGGGIQ